MAKRWLIENKFRSVSGLGLLFWWDLRTAPWQWGCRNGHLHIENHLFYSGFSPFVYQEIACSVYCWCWTSNTCYLEKPFMESCLDHLSAVSAPCSWVTSPCGVGFSLREWEIPGPKGLVSTRLGSCEKLQVASPRHPDPCLPVGGQWRLILRGRQGWEPPF